MTTQGCLWSADGAALALLLVASVADHRRHRRRDLDAAGWMPWQGLQVLGFAAVLLITIIALRAH